MNPPKNLCESKTRERSSAEDEVRPLVSSFITMETLHKVLKKKTSYFVTMNPYKKGKYFDKFQKIGRAYDILKRYATAFYLVREFNPDGTSHYHAVCGGFKANKAPPKGCTFYVERVGGDVAPRSFDSETPPTTLESVISQRIYPSLKEELGEHHHMLDLTYNYLLSLATKQIKCLSAQRARCKKLVMGGHLARVINYMNKTTPSVEYQDYMFKGITP